MDVLLKTVQEINAYLSDYILIILLIGTGLFFTFRTRFVQIRCFGEGMRRMFGNFSLRGGNQGGGMSSFQALATAVAAQVGTGNIVGASGAILLGGPGAIFWMWIIAFFGMATIYAEAVLAQETRVKTQDGSIHGGPVYYIERAFDGNVSNFGKFLGGCFAFAIILALGFMGCMVQSNSIAETCTNAFGVPGWGVGVVVALFSVVVFLGGVQRLAAVTEKLVPLMAILYLIGGLIVLLLNITAVPEAIGMIFKYAFQPSAIIGGSLGAAIKIAISQGAKRGLFSNEAGMGSTPHAHAMAKVDKPHDQGVVAMVGVFIDTFVVLTMTALVVITMLYAKDGEIAKTARGALAQASVVQQVSPADPVAAQSQALDSAEAVKAAIVASGIQKTNMVQKSFAMVFGDKFGNIFVAICLLFFAYSTILSWNMFGKINAVWLFGNRKIVVGIYSVISVGFIFLGSILSNDMVWELTDLFNQLMVLPNVMALLALSGIVVAASKGKK
ncbi:MAG: sodium:alanine symporter family protein [Victivallales bacterium]|nr:sodium:alanine symporter family protein [Victivallales bacterium]